MRTRRYNLFSFIGAILREIFGGSKSQDFARRKLDARLAFLLSLSEEERRGIKNREEEELRSVDEQIASLRQEVDSALDREALDEETAAAFQARFEALEDRLASPLTAGLYLTGELSGIEETVVSAFILSDASAMDLEELGARVRSQAGDVFTALVPLPAVPALEASAAVRYIELAPAYFPSLDVAVPFAQIDTVQAATPSVTGAGVIVGVIDTTLDIYHPDFRTAAAGGGTDPSRVLFLWDQFLTPTAGEAGPPTDPTLPGFLVGGTTYGVEYDQADINTELGNYDPTGTPPTPAYLTVRHGGTRSAHGTHVAGIAVGNGRGDATRVGAAPGADIIYVRYGANALVPLADSSFVMDAFAYVFARASVLGQPCVINFSSSRNMGPHDGTTLGEQFLDNLLLTPGRVITAAAGNTDNKNSHAAGQVAAGGTTNLVINYFGVDTDGDGTPDMFPTTNDVMEIWYDGHDRFTSTITTPGGTVIGPVAAGGNANVALGGGVSVQVTSTINDPRNGDNVITIIINTGGAQIPVGNWTIALNGATVVNGAFQAWVERNNRFLRTWSAPLLQAGQLTIASPATAKRVMTVGNHEDAALTATPTIWVSSSRGPTRDGRIKPEIAANGQAVMAARSRNMNDAAPGALYVSKTGTSMAAPLVGGASALLFECRGAGATWADVKQILTDTAGVQGTAAGSPLIPVPSNAFGFGYLQMGSACAAPATDVDVWLRDHTSDTTGAEPFTGAVAYLSPDIEVLDTTGAPVPNPTYHPTNRFNNLIRVTVRNRGTQTARDTEVFLYWGDPATNIPFPAEWRSTGIYTGGPAYVNQTNKIVIPELPGLSTTQVTFAWAPPAPGSGLAGDDHFCLMARLENEADSSNIGSGGWSSIRASNNIALRNTHVQPAPTGTGSGDEEAEITFYVEGTADTDTLIIEVDMLEGVPELHVPVRTLPWRDRRLIERVASREPQNVGAPRGCLALVAWLMPAIFRRLFPTPTWTEVMEGLEATLDGRDVALRTDVVGARRLRVRNGNATIEGAEGTKLVLTQLKLDAGERIPVRLRIRNAAVGGEWRFAHAMQLSGGQYVGGVTLELRDM